MAKTESTAVTEFINSVRRQPVDGYGTNRGEMSIRNGPAQPPPNPAAAGTPAPEWSTPPTARARGTMPPSARTTATMAPPPIPSRATAPRPVVRAPSQLIVPPHLQASPAELELIDDTAEQPKLELAALAAPALTGPVERTWFDAPQAQIEALDIPDFGTEDDDDLDVSIDFERPARRKIGLMALGCLVVAGGIATAAYIAFSGGTLQRSAPAAQAIAPANASAVPAATPVAPAAAPAAAPAVVDTETAAPAPVEPTGVVLHRANFTSEPEGATVTLVMNGRPVVLGAAPVDAQLDPTKSYEVVFTMPGRETVLRSVVFDDSGTIAVSAALSEADADTAVAAIEPEPEAVEPEPEAVEPEPAPVARKATRKKKTRSARRSSRSSRSKPAVATSIPKGSGVLMLNAKPPCDIVIDGRPTGKQTPQRALSLAPGKHRIGLVNKTYGIKASFTVSIKAGEKKRVIKDMTDRI